MEKPIPDGLVEKVREWLGEEGKAFFSKCKTIGTVAPALPGWPPHPVHWREGMQVRNFMRDTELCEGWDAHDFDDNWCEVVKQAIAE